jgi:hypothetical protein
MSPIRKQSLIQHLSSGFNAIISNAGIFIPVTLALGTLDVFLFRGALSLNGFAPTDNILQMQIPPSALMKLTFSFLGLAIGVKAIVGPIIGMLVVLFSRAHAKSTKLNLNNAINFISKRYKSVFVPYLLAMLSIQVGMLIVIPGIMFMMQYAFVDSVATLEKEKHVLTRSKRLTKSRRKSLVMLILPFVLLGQGMQFVDFIYSSNLPALIGFHSLYEGLFLVIASTFYMLYHERILLIEQHKARKAAKQAQQDNLDTKEGSDADTNTESKEGATEDPVENQIKEEIKE